MAITDGGKEKVAELLEGLLDDMEVTIDGAPQTFAFSTSTHTDDRVQVSALIDDTHEGLISLVRLYDTDGDVFAERSENIDKPLEKLLLISFAYTVTEEAV